MKTIRLNLHLVLVKPAVHILATVRRPQRSSNYFEATQMLLSAISCTLHPISIECGPRENTHDVGYCIWWQNDFLSTMAHADKCILWAICVRWSVGPLLITFDMTINICATKCHILYLGVRWKTTTVVLCFLLNIEGKLCRNVVLYIFFDRIRVEKYA